MTNHLVVIGGGAAGFFCAVNAARMNPLLKVTILERQAKLLSKVKISGGGRCNVTHACFTIDDMSRNYPRGGNFVKKAFHQFFTTDTLSWYEERGVKLKAENDGRMFPVTNTSQTIINCLLNEAARYNVIVNTNTEVSDVQREGEGFVVELLNHQKLPADYIVVATGGLSGKAGINWLKKFNHTIHAPVPSLFTFNLSKENTGQHSKGITQLMGVAVENVSVKIAGTKLVQTGSLLITHWGFSGPAVLKLSAWGARELSERNWNFDVLVNWLGNYNEQELKEIFIEQRIGNPSLKVCGRNKFQLPNRLWEFLAIDAGIKEDMRWADVPSAALNKFIRNLCAYTVAVKGKTTFKEEFVTAGGIATSEISHNTMMSKVVPNLFFAGEIMDVDGITGGFNFQHAWTSGFIAAKAIAGLSLAEN